MFGRTVVPGLELSLHGKDAHIGSFAFILCVFSAEIISKSVAQKVNKCNSAAITYNPIWLVIHNSMSSHPFIGTGHQIQGRLNVLLVISYWTWKWIILVHKLGWSPYLAKICCLKINMCSVLGGIGWLTRWNTELVYWKNLGVGWLVGWLTSKGHKNMPPRTLHMNLCIKPLCDCKTELSQ